jgi:Pyruvate/2-oxoacid:ferredoxin oxidoreductase delta subunit/flavodoxin
MRSVCIHVFSGTGNSLNAASIIEGRLDCAGWTTRLVRVDRTALPPAGLYDLHVFTFPVYALDVPEIMLRYIRRLPSGNGAEAVVVATIGKLWAGHSIPGDSGDEGGAVEHVRDILARKGYDVTITDAVSFPANVTLGRLSAGRKEVPGILRQSDGHVNRIADDILARERRVKRYLPLVPQAWILVSTLFYHHIGRRSIGKMYVASKKCNSCGHCVRTCPAGAIRMERGRPRWNWQCEGCHRCINTCPQSAIEGSALRAMTMIALVFVPYAELFTPVLAFAGIVLPDQGIAAFLGGLACWLAGYTLFFMVLDIINALLERPPVNCPFALFGYTRGAERYTNPAADVNVHEGR